MGSPENASRGRDEDPPAPQSPQPQSPQMPEDARDPLDENPPAARRIDGQLWAYKRCKDCSPATPPSTMRKVEAKDAVVFIIDANYTMNSPYQTSGADNPVASSTRLSQAKDAVCSQLVDLMWRTKTNEADVIVLRAGGSF